MYQAGHTFLFDLPIFPFRGRQDHRKTVAAFPGNKTHIFRGNPTAKRRFEELTKDCQDLLNPDLGYDEGKSY